MHSNGFVKKTTTNVPVVNRLTGRTNIFVYILIMFLTGNLKIVKSCFKRKIMKNGKTIISKFLYNVIFVDSMKFKYL